MSGFGIFSGMPRELKTPQEKKRLQLEKDHFTFSNAPHAFRKNWKKKKSNLNRQYPRKDRPSFRNVQEAIGRKVNHKRHYDEIVQAAMKTLLQLEGDQFKDAVDRIARLLQGGDPIEWLRLYQSKDRLDRAIFFVEEISRGNASYLDALRRDQELCLSFQSWKKKVNRILARTRRPAMRKLEQKIATEKKLKAVVRESRTR